MANIYCTVPICHILKSQQVFSHLIFMTQCQSFTDEEAEAEIDSETRSKPTAVGIPTDGARMQIQVAGLPCPTANIIFQPI